MSYILLVDDEEPIRYMLAQLLTAEGYTVRGARNGREALDEVAGDCPGLIILDLMMPVMDGFTFLRALPTVAPDPPPVLALTAMHGGEEALAGQGDYPFLAKPFDVGELLARVRQLYRIANYE